MKRSERLAIAEAVGYTLMSFEDEDGEVWVTAVRPALDFGNGVEPEQVIYEKRVTVFNPHASRLAQARLAILFDLRQQMRRSGGSIGDV